MVDLRSTDPQQDGALMKKGWRFGTNCPYLRKALEGLKCDGSHSYHAKCQGVATENSGRYTDNISERIHCALDERATNIQQQQETCAHIATPCIGTTHVDHCAYPSIAHLCSKLSNDSPTFKGLLRKVLWRLKTVKTAVHEQVKTVDMEHQMHEPDPAETASAIGGAPETDEMFEGITVPGEVENVESGEGAGGNETPVMPHSSPLTEMAEGKEPTQEGAPSSGVIVEKVETVEERDERVKNMTESLRMAVDESTRVNVDSSADTDIGVGVYEYQDEFMPPPEEGGVVRLPGWLPASEQRLAAEWKTCIESGTDPTVFYGEDWINHVLKWREQWISVIAENAINERPELAELIRTDQMEQMERVYAMFIREWYQAEANNWKAGMQEGDPRRDEESPWPSLLTGEQQEAIRAAQETMLLTQSVASKALTEAYSQQNETTTMEDLRNKAMKAETKPTALIEKATAVFKGRLRQRAAGEKVTEEEECYYEVMKASRGDDDEVEDGGPQ